MLTAAVGEVVVIVLVVIGVVVVIGTVIVVVFGPVSFSPTKDELLSVYILYLLQFKKKNTDC
jgi:hypothetical protein